MDIPSATPRSSSPQPPPRPPAAPTAAAAAAAARDDAPPPPPPPPPALRHGECAALSARCYCEENAVRVLRLAAARGVRAEALFAVFISNAQRRVPLRLQRAGAPPLGLACWDYHVVAEVQRDIYDVDSLLPFPSARLDYFRRSCRDGGGRYQFRRVRFEDMDRFFASDRRHMRDGSGGLRMRPPPAPPIRGRDAHSAHTLNSFLAVDGLTAEDPFRPGRDAPAAPGELFASLDALLKALAADAG